MAWTRKLLEPITLYNGRVFRSLHDAAEFALKLSDRQQADPAWQHAIGLLMRAAEAGASEDVLKEAERQLYTALKGDGLIG
jgi:hypothetical protein